MSDKEMLGKELLRYGVIKSRIDIENTCGIVTVREIQFDGWVYLLIMHNGRIVDVVGGVRND